MSRKEERRSDVEYFQANWIYCDNKQALNGKINYSLKLCIINQVSGLLFVAFFVNKKCFASKLCRRSSDADDNETAERDEKVLQCD